MRRWTVGSVAALILVVGLWWWLDERSWENVEVILDGESSLILRRRATHPYFAEYERRIVVLRRGREIATLKYQSDPGGGFPMQVHFHANEERRVARITDLHFDCVIDLRTGEYDPAHMPPEGKESESFVKESALPPLRQRWVVDRYFRASPMPLKKLGEGGRNDEIQAGATR